MATTIQSKPIGGGTLSPAYNPIVWSLLSGNINLPGFRYVVDLKEGSTVLSRLELPPIAPSGYTAFDASTILSNFVTHQNINTNVTGDHASESYIGYGFDVFERYQVSYGWTGISQSNSSLNYSAYTQLEFQSSTPFQPNDQIQNFVTGVDQLLAGILTVIDVINDTTIVVNRQWSQLMGTGITVGDAIYADGRKFTSEAVVEQPTNFAFNGALKHVDLKDYNSSQFAMGSVFLGDFLSYLPKTFTVRENTSLGMNFYNGINTTNRRLIITNGVTTKFLQFTTTNKPLIYLALGPGNINESSFTLLSGPAATLTSGGSQFYEAYVANSSNGQLSARYRFNIDYTCSKFDDYCVVFLDRLGSLGAFSFIYNNVISEDVTKEIHNTQIGSYLTGNWSFGAEEASFSPTFIEAKKRIQLTTSWLTQDESDYFNQLITSPKTWINIGGEFYPLNVITSTAVREDKRRTKNIRYVVDFEFANRDSINW